MAVPRIGTGAFWAVLAVAGLTASVAGAADSEDTARLAAHLATLRGLKEMSAAQYEKIQSEYLDWIDRRVTAGVGVAGINRELGSAGLFASEPTTDADYFARSDTGYLGGVSERSVRGAGDLFVIEVAIPTGVYCSSDSTAVIYQRRPVKRIGWINGQQLDGHGYYLTGIAAGPESSGGRVIATGWNRNNCTSAWTGKIARIDRVNGGPVTRILRRDLWAYSSREEEVAPWVRGDEVTFFYDSGSFIMQVFVAPAIARYRLVDGQARREGPLALTVAGFIHEWLQVSDAEAARWSTPAAMRMHAEAAREIEHQVAVLEGVAQCGGAPTVWEVAVRLSDSKELRVFRVEGDRATTLRMGAVAGETSRSCTSLGDDGRDAIAKELPW